MSDETYFKVGAAVAISDVTMEATLKAIQGGYEAQFDIDVVAKAAIVGIIIDIDHCATFSYNVLFGETLMELQSNEIKKL
jgi:hypothetical protein